MVNNLPAKQDMWVQFLGQKDPLEKEMATHSTLLAWETPWMEEPGELQSMGGKELDMTERLTNNCVLCYALTQPCLILCDPVDL